MITADLESWQMERRIYEWRIYDGRLADGNIYKRHRKTITGNRRICRYYKYREDQNNKNGSLSPGRLDLPEVWGRNVSVGNKMPMPR